MKEAFERWVSLGDYCLPKFQINRYIANNFFGFTGKSAGGAHTFIKSLPKDIVNGVNGGNYLFDWVIVEDYQKIIAEIENGLSYELDRSSLEERYDDNGNIKHIACNKLGLIWHHLFPKENGKFAKNWESHLEVLKPKVERLRTKFANLADYKTLYVITFSKNHKHKNIPDLLADALKVFRGNDNFSILVTIPNKNYELPMDSDKIYYRLYDNKADFPEYPWLGNSTSWDHIFSSFELTPRNTVPDGLNPCCIPITIDNSTRNSTLVVEE